MVSVTATATVIARAIATVTAAERFGSFKC